ncbi:TonB family protein [Steroidobacter sp.]|uniref:TonB family protein n=1 Tax=Steroidobacter sp. TaxID=1978227 RepID=UPI0025E2BC9C|nr:TonB family protein [Steroidobacter sp.]
MRVTLAAEEETPTQGFSKRGLLMIVGVALLVLIATWFVLRSPSSEPGEMEHSLVTVPKPKPEPVEETDRARTPEIVDAPTQPARSTITKPQATTPASTPSSGPSLRSSSTAPNQVARATAQNPAGAVLHEALPTVPDKIRNGIQGRIYVTVRVLVDPEGNVTGALMESPGPSKYFARLADNAAREWQFAPEDGDRSRVWRLTFLFTRDGETVRASEQ